MPKRTGIRNRIHKVGVELEGGWDKLPQGVRAIEHDGSVSMSLPGVVVVDAHGRAVATAPAAQRGTGLSGMIDEEAVPLRSMPRIIIGEIPSPALEMKSYAEWMTSCYPKHVNETCGLHAHMSFKYRIHYMRLMTPELTPHIVKGLINWAEEEKLAGSHPIWPRLLRKDHRHCAHIYLGDNQVKTTRKDYNSRGTPYSRYTALNYCYSKEQSDGSRLGTVECRLLPMMETPDQAVRAVTTVFDLTNKFLSQMKKKEPRAEAKVALAPTLSATYRIGGR